MLHQVGVGALGPVFRTYEPTRDRLVAIKVFRLDITPEQARALADELSISAQAGLFHPSIVEPIAAGVEGSVAYRAEEYVAAESLDVAMRHYAPAATDKVLPFISQLAAAIDFARLNGVGHGALHPRDIFVTPDEARATGFGVVEALERVGLRAPVRRPYSAPERVAGEKWGTAADVFSLGAIAYELLTGRRPAGVGAAAGDLSGASVGQHEAAVLGVLVRAMEEDPAARYPTAMAFAATLEAASRGESVVPAPAVIAGPAVAAGSIPEPPAAGLAIDDITPERDEDEAFATLAREERELERAPTQARDLFDLDAVDGLALGAGQRFRDDFDPHELDEPRPAQRFAETLESEPSLNADGDDHVERYRDTERSFDPTDDDGDAGFVTPSRRSIDYVPDDGDDAVRPRRPMLPLALMLLLGLIIGFGAGFGAGTGYGAASRSRPASSDEAKADAGDERPSEPGQPKPESGKAYSDQAVTPSPQKPPAEPPPIPGDAPAPAQPAASAPTPAAPAATSGRLIVRSVPSNAGVTLDGAWRGRTPLTLDKLRLGTHEVRVVQPGFAIGRQTVALTASAPARTLSFRLQPEGAAPTAPEQSPAAPATKPTAPSPAPAASSPQPPSAVPPVAGEARGPGSLYVDSRPRGAAVFLDGKQMGVTPTTIRDVTPGPHMIRLQLPDHRVWSTSTQVLPGQQTTVRGSLERIQ